MPDGVNSPYIPGMEPKRIKDFVVNDPVTNFFIVRKKEVREFTRGQYVSLELGDATGRLDGVMWEPDQFALEECVEGTIVKVKGVVTEYKNRTQITINRIRIAVDGEYRLEEILPHSAQSLETRRARIFDLTEKIENSYIKSILMSFWSDEKFLNEFLMSPAGKLWHHATIGGLSEHSANVAELAMRVASQYDFITMDFVIFGGLFHDVGKIATYTRDMVFDYTDEGRLVGHICIADQWLCDRATKIEAFPPTLLMKLRHILLSHQGELQYATPVVPQMPEAFIVYYCDEIDSKMGAIQRIRDRQGGKGWSEYVKMLDRFLYFGD